MYTRPEDFKRYIDTRFDDINAFCIVVTATDAAKSSTQQNNPEGRFLEVLEAFRINYTPPFRR